MVPESFQRIASNGVPWMTVVVMGVALLAAVALRLPELRGVVARVRRKPRPGMFPGGAALTGATGYCGSPGQA